MGVPPLDHAIDVPGLFPRLSHPVHQTAIENLRIPATSQDPVTAHAIHSGIDTSTITVPLSTPEPSASTPTSTSMTSTSPPGIVAAQDIAYNRLSTDVLDVSSLPFRTPVIDDIPPTESHSSLLAPAASGRSHSRQSSAPDPGASVEGEGGAKAGLHKEEDTLDPPSAIRENIMTTPDIPSQLPSPPLS
ncbi:hypothetical protein BJY52DRAFT_1320807 [Lactarius psammicola]|nr:hypothetical protein BJY52DRAFT_1320807 [Lactarius psammicola]